MHPALERLLEKDFPGPWPRGADKVAVRSMLVSDPMRYIQDVHPADPLAAFDAISSALSDENYWRNLSELWICQLRVYHQLPAWRRRFSASRAGREHLMKANERQRLAMLPSKIEVFRGFSVEGGQDGLAWATKRATAEGFAAQRVDQDSPRVDGLFVARATIPSERVIACFDREYGCEVEVIVPNFRGCPRTVECVATREEVEAERASAPRSIHN